MAVSLVGDMTQLPGDSKVEKAQVRRAIILRIVSVIIIIIIIIIAVMIIIIIIVVIIFIFIIIVVRIVIIIIIAIMTLDGDCSCNIPTYSRTAIPGWPVGPSS